jgi:hypothetical protein
MEKTFRYYHLDTHTAVLSEALTQEEKKEFGIDENLHAIFNEIGFSTPVNSEAWEKDCFNVLVSEDEEFDNIEVVLLDISKLPKRLESTYKKILEEREN